MQVQVDDVEIVSLSDGDGRFPHTFAELFPGVAEGSFAPWRELHPAAHAKRAAPGEPDTPQARWGCFLLRTPSALVLVDTGFGAGAAAAPSTCGSCRRAPSSSWCQA